MPEADLRIEALGPLTPLLSGKMTAAEALSSQLLRIEGPVDLLARFAQVFRIGPD